MPSHVDQIADRNKAELARLVVLYDFPAFVKQAKIEEIMAARHVPMSAYADPVRKQFPCDTAESTWVSALYYQEKAAEFHPKDRVQIERRLENYVGYFRIKAACDYIKTRWQQLHKTAEEQLPDHDFAYVRVGDDGRKERHLRMQTAAEVKAAADYLEQYRDRFSFSVRHAAARRILEKAARLGASISDNREFLERQAGMGVCDPDEVVAMIERRAMLVPAGAGITVKTAEDGKTEHTNSLRDQFLKMAQTIREMPRKALQSTTLVKLAETIDALDHQLDFVSRYGPGLPRPEDVIFSATFTKSAGDIDKHAALTTGKIYEKQAFKKLALADVEALLGTDFAQRVGTPLGEVDVEKFAEEAQTLPMGDAVMLENLLSDTGITPTLVKAARARQGFIAEEMKVWAAEYAAE